MRFDIVTVFPEMFDPLKKGVIGRAISSGKLQLETHDLRDHGLGAYRQVDDSPYGGGAGMILRLEPIVACVRAIQEKHGAGKVVILSAAGRQFTQSKAREFSSGEEHLILVCGRYEGVDARVAEIFGAEEISIGPYVLSGGEIPAMVLIDAVSRLIPGVLGREASLEQESHDEEGLVEYPQYTRPENFEGHGVPEVLLGGNHAEIEKWRAENRRRA
mgnify:CR=1 FL=1